MRTLDLERNASPNFNAGPQQAFASRRAPRSDGCTLGRLPNEVDPGRGGVTAATLDSKSSAREGVRVQLPPPVPLKSERHPERDRWGAKEPIIRSSFGRTGRSADAARSRSSRGGAAVLLFAEPFE